MRIEQVPISGLMIISPNVFEDPRGYFFESYSKKAFEEAGITEEFVQSNQSLSQKGVLRGLHFQHPPHAQSKLVRVIQGSVLDVALDIRKGSPTYGQHFSIVLSAQNKTMFYVPVGFAHGFLTLEDNTIFSYKCGNYYNKPAEDGILWNDSDLNIEWNVENPILSEKDKVNTLFRDFNSPFTHP
ncbi:MAG TPA: dTDP-4-dehydrorhamnose 3,5-epimerase [Flavobacteriales bacterium]|nr:dTDP-4-dehydrorhamnose 3,5-epimerase [Flavobacteriales bacterium]HPH83371.1 dTDP-4-dehydrorhamnose 3,5-epimerase [Flavobacteriales bacterium]